MTVSRDFIVYAFDTTRDAMAAHRTLQDAGVEAKTIPRPVAFGADCGVAVRVPAGAAAAAEDRLTLEGLPWAAKGSIRDL